MEHRTMRTGLHLVFAASLLAAATGASAQCTNTGGGAPVPEPALMVRMILIRGLGGIWGDGNDRFKALKGMFNASAPIDPVTTHDVHITIRKNADSGPVIFTTTLPAGSFWSSSGASFVFADPSATYGIRKMIMKNAGSGFYIVTRILGRDVSLANMPLVSGDDLHLTLEFESGGTGDCFGDDLPDCTYGAATQVCDTF
jgi:hypothetical protein